MTKTLVIVESPAKAKTIKKYLGSGFDVIASKGHLKDLPKNQNAVDVAKDFTEKYEVIEGKEKILEELKAAAKKVDTVLLATDPDREGEAIAFHISEEIQDDKLKVARVEFHEITKRGVDQGVNHPRPLDANLYDAQRARRVLDRIVGYDVSALVWSKLAFGLSAGRVQSVALRLITDREKEIDAFVPQEYWNVAVTLSAPSGASFDAKLASAGGEKIEVTTGERAARVQQDLESATFKVARVTRREQKRNPPAPYTTSKLQQDATNLLHFGAKRTMQIAQALYEGIDLKQDGGPVGLITYMRTDSTRVSDDAVAEVRAAIEKRYGKAFVPDKPNVYKTKKNAQDAHEAIRPTNIDLRPDAIKKHLKEEQYKLYKLIWNRFVASQMTPAIYDRTTVETQAKVTHSDALFGEYLLRSTGRVLKSSGWLEVTEGQRNFAGDEDAEAQPAVVEAVPEADGKPAASADDDNDALLPELGEGNEPKLVRPPGVVAEQKFTQPPPRYNEGSLVRELEKRGIGRPSTYAEIIGKVQQRAYVEKLPGGAFQPSMLGKFVVDGLVRSNLDFMDPNFTAQMEEELDEVGTGKIKREQLLRRFYKRFREQLDKSKKLASWKPPSETTEIVCDECGDGFMVKKWGKNGWFLSCERYPKCKGTKDLGVDGNSAASVRETEIHCNECDKLMVVRSGRYGDFLSCTGYPSCKNTRPVPLGVACPQCGGDLIEVRSRKKGGRTFYGCSNFSAEQKCEFKLWAKPVPIPCPVCAAPFLTRAGGKTPMLVCATKDCPHKQEFTEEMEAELAAMPIVAPKGGLAPRIPREEDNEGSSKTKAKPSDKGKAKAKDADKPKPSVKAKDKPVAKKVETKTVAVAKPADKGSGMKIIKRKAGEGRTARPSD